VTLPSEHYPRNQRPKRIHWLRWALICCAILALCFTGIALDIYRYSSASDALPADAAIVLGAAARNGQPSPVFEERIKHAIDLYNAGRVNSLLFTGGVGKDEQVAESMVAKAYAVGRGVAEKDIFCETQSRITYENLRGAKAIIEKQHLGRVLVVSDPLHLRRAMTMAQDLGLDAHPSLTPTSRYISWKSRTGFLWSETCYYATYVDQERFLEFHLNALFRQQLVIHQFSLDENTGVVVQLVIGVLRTVEPLGELFLRRRTIAGRARERKGQNACKERPWRRNPP